MEEILFWLIVIPVMCVIGAIWVIRSTPMKDNATMGIVPPRLVPPRDTSVDESLIYDVHKSIPERGTLLNRPPNPYLDIVIRPHDRRAAWLESFMLAIGTFLLKSWHALTEREELPIYRCYQPIETGERSEPPQGGSVLASGKYTVQEVADGLAMLGWALYLDAQNRPYVATKPTPSSGYTPLLDDDPYTTEQEDEVVLKLPAPQVDPLLIGKEYH